MENDPEVIRKEMQETRTSLSEKLEALSQQVVGTVQDARGALKETVETVRDAVTDTVSTVKDQVTGTVADVKQSVTGTVDSVKDSMTGTVESFKGSVEGTVDSMKETFDLERQVVSHPWLMVGGAVALGYVSGRLMSRPAMAAHTFADFPPPRPSVPVPANEGWESTRSTGASAAPAAQGFASAAPAPPAMNVGLPSFLSGFEPEIQRLKGVAIGALFGVVRDLVQQKLPPNLTEPVTKVVDDLTIKMGGQPVRGHILDPGGSNGR